MRKLKGDTSVPEIEDPNYPDRLAELHTDAEAPAVLRKIAGMLLLYRDENFTSFSALALPLPAFPRPGGETPLFVHSGSAQSNAGDGAAESELRPLTWRFPLLACLGC